ncbi:MAG: hypothetical protein K0Q49_2065 [Haloplasmataceae bacterium]|nr:hypothetical protein [Haloplasmataceae bacterium]
MENNFEELIEMAESALWKYSYKDDSLATILKNFTKTELVYLKDCLGIESGSNLKKQELYNKIIEDLIYALPETLQFFNSNHMKYLNKFLNDESYLTYDPSEFEVHVVQFLNSIGLIFPLFKDGQKIIVMPIEIKQLFNDLHKDNYQAIIQQNTGFMNLLYGYANLYGAYEFDKLEPFNLLIDEMLYKIQYLVKYDNLINYRLDADDNFIYQTILEDSLDDFNDNIDDDLDYFTFTKEEIQNASHIDYIEENEYTTKLRNLIKFEFDLEEEEIKLFIVSIINYLKMGYKANYIIDYIENENGELPYTFKTKLIQLLKILEKTTRKWTLKGHREIDLNKDKIQSKFIKFTPKR